ncbi:hypothetical protein B1R32_11256 [Abditibacterium utsteinense]|uniref:Uncharacterized protein n=1 Tax=Abditibacterium utsteinense TaxID=1960156 RepID=A0A2S8SRG6_9BACT|nr:hypothetical protein [Abditibacterium utsteinense]PQV63401.1 hypothetical protein B1R32_11256 [Abditibacterium utsteinense]
MFIAAFILIGVFVIFALANLFAAATFGLGLLVLLALGLRRRGEFWLLLLGAALFGGGGGALGAAYGVVLGASQRWPHSIWLFADWILGYVSGCIGGIGGACVASFFVVLRHRSVLSRIKFELKTCFDSTKNQVKRSGFRQTLRIGAYSLRLAFFKRDKAIRSGRNLFRASEYFSR